MKSTLFNVVLKGYEQEVWALTKNEAVILVQAEAIKKCLDYELIFVSEVS